GEGGLAAGAKLRRFGASDRRGSVGSDAFFGGLTENRDARALGRLVGVLIAPGKGRANAVRPGPPMLTNPGGGALTSRTPNTTTPPGVNRSARYAVALRTAGGSK